MSIFIRLLTAPRDVDGLIHNKDHMGVMYGMYFSRRTVGGIPNSHPSSLWGLIWELLRNLDVK